MKQPDLVPSLAYSLLGPSSSPLLVLWLLLQLEPWQLPQLVPWRWPEDGENDVVLDNNDAQTIMIVHSKQQLRHMGQAACCLS
jgi:hypothetical protein